MFRSNFDELNGNRFDDLIGCLYETLAAGDDWIVMLDQLSDMLGARFISSAAFDAATNRLLWVRANSQATPQVIIEYLRQWHPKNPRAALMLGLQAGQSMQCHHHFDDAFVATNPFYQDFLIPNGGRYTATTRVMSAPDHFVILFVTRSQQAGPLTESEMALLERFRFHLARALQIHPLAWRTDGEWEVGRQLVAQHRYPTIVVDQACRMVFRNQAAAMMLARGHVFVERHGMLVVRRQDDDRRYRTLMAEVFGAVDRPAESRVLSLRPDASALQLPVFVSLLQPQPPLLPFGGTPMAMLVVHEAEESSGPDPESVAMAFELTPTEARIAAQLARGRTAEQISVDHRVSLTTVRSQIKSLFAKTGARRQVDLIRIISTMPDLAMLRTGTC